MGLTMAEKILNRASGRDRVTPGEIVTPGIDRLMVIGELWKDVLPFLDELKVERVWDPDRVVVIHEHSSPPSTISAAERYVQSRQAVKKFGIKNFFDMGR